MQPLWHTKIGVRPPPPPLHLIVKLYDEINFFNNTNRENYFELKYKSFEFFCLVHRFLIPINKFNRKGRKSSVP